MPKKIPIRTCAGCGQKKEKGSMIRIIRTPEGEIRLDRTGRAQGRGVYLCPDPACLAQAQKKHALSRSLGVPVPEDVYQALAQELEQKEP